jgi:hypothetical protein
MATCKHLACVCGVVAKTGLMALVKKVKTFDETNQ